MDQKRQITQYKHLLNFGANLILFIVEVGLFAYLWYSYYIPLMLYPFWNRGYLAVVFIYGLVLYLLTKGFNGYRIGYLRLSDIWLSHFLSILMSGLVGYLVLNLIDKEVARDPKPVLMMVVAQIIFMIPWVYIIRKAYAKLYPPRQMLIVYGEHSPINLISKINTRKDKYDLCTAINYHSGYEAVCKQIMDHEGVILCDLPAEERNDLMKFCYENGIRAYITPKISDLLLKTAQDIHLFDTPLYISRNQGLSINQKFAKRIFDIVVSLMMLIVLCPFMLITAICIKAYDGGPVFYVQDRLTRGKRNFGILKFRSMKVDSEKKGARLAAKDDDRITPVGKVIRRIHFDEIPQLINILKGDMSMVGPRPEREVIHEQYKMNIPEFDYRLKVKAGLTGYAQVYGKYNTTPYDKLKMDITYIQNYSLLLDFKLMLLTVKVIFQKENSEGVNADQITAESLQDEDTLEYIRKQGLHTHE